MSYRGIESELSRENTVLRRVQGAMSYDFGIRLNVNKKVSTRESAVLAADHKSQA